MSKLVRCPHPVTDECRHDPFAADSTLRQNVKASETCAEVEYEMTCTQCPNVIELQYPVFGSEIEALQDKLHELAGKLHALGDEAENAA